MLPILSEVPYTVNMKTKMIANKTAVWELLDQMSFGRKVHRGVLLVAKKGRTHTTSDDVDTDTKGNEEARLESNQATISLMVTARQTAEHLQRWYSSP